ncbi:hypothetical protein [Shewanella maritima]|uniref:hypothetical protein n=1 Tax=Shewanella maritima TaxID=2520507 RepID=UPI003736A6F7
MNTNTQIASESAQRPQGGPPPPPPPGATPPGLEDAVSALTDEEQQQISQMLSNMTKEQHEELKMALDELKPQTQSLSNKDIGNVFLETLTQITQATSDSNDGIDTYA